MVFKGFRKCVSAPVPLPKFLLLCSAFSTSMYHFVAREVVCLVRWSSTGVDGSG